MQSTEWIFEGQTASIAARSWTGSTPRYMVLLAHGYGEHLGRYEHVATRLVADGAMVVGVDHLGHGRSGGERVLVQDFETVVADLHTADLEARDRWPGLPVILIGHSMGGLIASRYAQRYGDTLVALVLSGPVIGRLDFVEQLLALDEIPDVPLDVAVLSRDPSVGEAYDADPLIWHGPFKRATLEAIRRTLAAIEAGGSIGQLPLLWIHGADDQLVPIEGSRSGVGTLRGETFESHEYQGARHEIFNETNSAEVLGDVVSFINGVLEDFSSMGDQPRRYAE